MIEIHHDVINQLLAWNAHPHKDDVTLDYNFSLAVLLSLLPEDVSKGGIGQEAVDFTFGKYEC